ncbi:hypothetical protein [Commensalibacter sp. Nvir]|uniref:hypothetical protein n=1 Tax=Commensalibacter sp. Nvir TaxID=3069817 RepID=UPI0030C88FDD
MVSSSAVMPVMVPISRLAIRNTSVSTILIMVPWELAVLAMKVTAYNSRSVRRLKAS